MIIGSPGSGKSTLARTLGARLDVPVYHMDREVHWLPGWTERPAEDKPAIVADIIAREAWVFEGGHSKSYAARAARADLLVWLDLPVVLRLFRVIRRSVRDHGKVRSDMPDGCAERFDMLPEFISFILMARRKSREKQMNLYCTAPCPKIRLTGPRSVTEWLDSLPQKECA